jgi:hypothetical protein
LEVERTRIFSGVSSSLRFGNIGFLRGTGNLSIDLKLPVIPILDLSRLSVSLFFAARSVFNSFLFSCLVESDELEESDESLDELESESEESEELESELSEDEELERFLFLFRLRSLFLRCLLEKLSALFDKR